MLKIERATVEAKIQNGYNFDFGKYISDGFNIFSKEWLLFSLYGLVSCVILTISFFTIVGFVLLLYPTLLGFSVAADKVERGEPLQFNDFFKAFKNFGQYAILGLIVLGCFILVFVPYLFSIYWITENDSPEAASIMMVFLMVFIFVVAIASYCLQALLIFTPYLIHYGNYSASAALKASFNLAKKKFWWLILFVFVVGIITSIGQYACLIGMFATIAAGMLMQYAMVKDILMNPEHSEIDQIGSHGYMK